MEGFVAESDVLDLDFRKSPFVCRSVFKERQRRPEFSVPSSRLGGEVVFTPPALVSGRIYNLTVYDASGEKRWAFVFDRKEKLPKRMYIGFNEKSGKWSARLTDCATGLADSVDFTVDE
jgi:hypothetical protein